MFNNRVVSSFGQKWDLVYMVCLDTLEECRVGTRMNEKRKSENDVKKRWASDTH